jgi:hypothetical protein
MKSRTPFRLTRAGAPLLGLTLAAAAAWAGPPQVQRSPPELMRVQPDLAVQSFTVAKTGVRRDGTNLVRLTVKVQLSAVSAASVGPFKIKTEWRPVRAAPGRVKPSFAVYSPLRDAGVSGMSTSGRSRALTLETRTFDDAVPSGSSREYRVTIDSLDQVDEGNESNNQATTTWEPTVCSGVDLELTRVRVHGSVNVWVRNRCSGTCEGEISYGYFPLDTGAGGITQHISSRIGGEEEIGPVGTMVASRHMRVWVAVDSGPCRDTNSGNNECVVELGDDETSRSFECRH